MDRIIEVGLAMLRLPARRTRRAGEELRAHPPLQPDRVGHPAAALPRECDIGGLGLTALSTLKVEVGTHELALRSRVRVCISADQVLDCAAAIETATEIETLVAGGVIARIIGQPLAADAGISRASPVAKSHCGWVGLRRHRRP